MTDLKKIVWLVSYPKSGNTWFRAFLTALLNPDNPEIDINNLHATTIASSRVLFDDLSGVFSADLTSDEINTSRPEIYRQNVLDSEGLIYHKVHDAWTCSDNGISMFPDELTRAVIYFIRNPLDVVISFSNHLSTNIDNTIDIMNNPDYAFCKNDHRLHNQLQQKLTSWSKHVESWTIESKLPVLVLKYEDMKNNTAETFLNAAKFIGLEYNEQEVIDALNKVSFEKLKNQEIEKGFHEKAAKSEIFFRKGLTDEWKDVLNNNQVKRITEAHYEMMKRFKYL